MGRHTRQKSSFVIVYGMKVPRSKDRMPIGTKGLPWSQPRRCPRVEAQLGLLGAKEMARQMVIAQRKPRVETRNGGKKAA
jgi:hypothetical protein